MMPPDVQTLAPFSTSNWKSVFDIQRTVHRDTVL